ncbi:MAG: helix-turn-helix domain-containing protein [Candidatus Merdivicinus sp.]|jgi:two-component system response regulator YesN
MKRLFALNRSQLFRKWLLSFLVILMIPSAIIVLDYIRYREVVKTSTLDYHYATLLQAQKMLDERLDSIQMLAIDLSMDSMILDYLESPCSDQVEERYQTSLLIDTLQQYRNIYPYIETMYLYSTKRDYLVTDQAAFSPDSIVSDENYQKVAEFLYPALQKSKAYAEFLLFPYKDAEYPKEDRLFLLHSIPLWTVQQANGMLALQLNEEAIMNGLQEVGAAEGGIFCILNAEGVPVLYKGDVSLLEACRQKSGSSLSRDFTIWEDTEYSLCSVGSKMSGWHYISMQPLNSYFSQLKKNRNQTFLLTAALYLVGVLFAWFFTKRNYRPVEMLVQKLQKTNSQLGDPADDELKYIDTVVEQTIIRGSQMMEHIQKELPMLQENLLRQLLQGNVIDFDAFVNSARTLQIDLNPCHTCVFLLNFVNYPTHSAEECSALRPIAVNELRRFAEEHRYRCYPVNMATDSFALIMAAEHAERALMQNYQSLAGEMMLFLRKQWMITAVTAVGTIGMEWKDLHASYLHAIRSWEHRVASDTSPVVCYTAGDGGKYQNFFYPVAMEEQLINLLKLGDLQKVRTFLQQIYTENFFSEQKSINHEMSDCLFLELLNTALKVFPLTGDELEAFWNSFNPIDTLSSLRSLRKRMEYLDGIMAYVCENLQKKRIDHTQRQKTQIVTFIQENFTDNAMSLSVVAEKFNLTPNYLSALFKEQLNTTFINYLTTLRVNQAKVYLKETSLTISEIALRVGYSNSNIFIRNFKKMQNLTPGEYREIAGNEPEE